MLETLLTKYGQQIVKGLRDSMAQKKLNNTGGTSRSIRFEVTESEGVTTLTIYGEENLLALNDGANPIKRKTTGKFIEEITKWAQSKLGLQYEEARGLAFGYLRNRTGKVVEGLRLILSGNYLVPNRFNSWGCTYQILSMIRLPERFKWR
jgi:hypothetical protein